MARRGRGGRAARLRSDVGEDVAGGGGVGCGRDLSQKRDERSGGGARAEEGAREHRAFGARLPPRRRPAVGARPLRLGGRGAARRRGHLARLARRRLLLRRGGSLGIELGIESTLEGEEEGDAVVGEPAGGERRAQLRLELRLQSVERERLEVAAANDRRRRGDGVVRVDVVREAHGQPRRRRRARGVERRLRAVGLQPRRAEQHRPDVPAAEPRGVAVGERDAQPFLPVLLDDLARPPAVVEVPLDHHALAHRERRREDRHVPEAVVRHLRPGRAAVSVVVAGLRVLRRRRWPEHD